MTLFYDYQLPVIACFFLFFAMIFYWISLSFPKNNFIFQGGRILVAGSNLLFMIMLGIRWVTQGYFPLSNFYKKKAVNAHSFKATIFKKIIARLFLNFSN